MLFATCGKSEVFLIMKKTNKFIIFLGIFLFAILFFNTKSFAATPIKFSNGETYEFDFSNCELKENYFIILSEKTPTISIFTWDNSVKFYATSRFRFLSDNGPFSFKLLLGSTIPPLSDFDTTSSITFGSDILGYFSNVNVPDENGSFTYYAKTGDIQFSNSKPNFVTTKETLESGNFDKLEINPNEFDYMDNSFVFRILEGIELDGQVVNYYPKMDFKLNYFSKYYFSDVSNSYHPFLIPKSNLGISFETGKSYKFLLLDKSSDNAKIFDSIEFTVAERKAEDVIKDKQDETNSRLDDQNKKLDEQNEKLDEQNKTSKGIWDTIKEVLSYINPFSENFFVYKLISLLIDAIKSLFIPSDDFFSNYFTNLKDWFSDRLGFLFYPFELIMDILDKIVNINFNDPVIHIPDINEPFTNNKLISATTFDFNSLLSNSILKNIHDIYLVGVDVVIVIALVNLAKRKWEEVSTK